MSSYRVYLHTAYSLITGQLDNPSNTNTFSYTCFQSDVSNALLLARTLREADTPYTPASEHIE